MAQQGSTPSPRAGLVWASAFHFFFVASVTWLKVAANALLIARSAAAWLPPLYILTALFTGVLALLLSRLPRRGNFGLPGLPLVPVALMMLGFWRLEGSLHAFGLAGLYLFAEAFGTLVSLRFWEVMGHTFDPRQARRIFTVLGASGMAGAMLAGALSPLLARQASAAALLLAASGGALLTGVCGLRFTRRWPSLRLILQAATEDVLPTAGRTPESRARALAYLTSDPYPRGLAICALLLAVLTAMVDYLFRRRAGTLLGEQALASLFGQVNLFVGMLAIVVQLGVSRAVLTRFGIFRYLALSPVGVLLTSMLALVWPGLLPVFLAKVTENAGSLSITQSGFQLLYGPLTPEVSAPVRGLVDGLMKKVGLALGGLLLLLLGTQCSDPVLVLASMGVALAAAVALVRQKPLYLRALSQRLQAARPLLGGTLDAESRRLLDEEVRSSEPHRVLNALELLAADRKFDPKPLLPGLLDHPSDRVRAGAVALALKVSARDQLPRLQELATTDPSPRVRDDAVEALAALLPENEVIGRMRGFLAASDPGLSAAAVVALWRLGGAGPALAQQGLAAILEGTRLDERREAARLIGRLSPHPPVDQLADYLADPDPTVRILACESAGRLASPSHLDRLFELMGQRATRRAAREALAAYGEGALPAAEKRLNDRSLPLTLRLEIPRLLRAIATEGAANALLFSNIQDDAFLQYRIGIALARWRDQNPALPVDSGRAREAIGRRLGAYRHFLPLYHDLRVALGPRAPLTRALADRLDQSLEVIFHLLGFIYPPQTLMAAHRRFVGSDARERAHALEFIDSLLDDALRLRVLPVLEAYHRAPVRETPGNPKRLAAHLAHLSGSRDSLLSSLARQARAEAQEGDPSVSMQGLEKILMLEGVDIFVGCNVDDLAALGAIAVERRFAAGETIYREGEPGETLYVIVDGKVRISKGGRVVLSLGPKEAFGSVSLLDGAPRPADAVAIGPVRCLLLGRADFLDLVGDRPELLKGVFSLVTGQLRRMLDLAASAAFSPASPPPPPAPVAPPSAASSK